MWFQKQTTEQKNVQYISPAKNCSKLEAKNEECNFSKPPKINLKLRNK